MLEKQALKNKLTLFLELLDQLDGIDSSLSDAASTLSALVKADPSAQDFRGQLDSVSGALAELLEALRERSFGGGK